jgi:hypothetical protein
MPDSEPGRRDESVDDVIARVEFYSDGPPGTDAYCDSGEALTDAKRLAAEILRLSVEREHYRVALERFAEIAAEALDRYRT